MKSIIILSWACALMSILAVSGLSASEVVPGSQAARLQSAVILGAAGVAVAWLYLAYWAQARRRSASLPPPSRLATKITVAVGVVYLLGVSLLALG
jgi:hypothetical protein